MGANEKGQFFERLQLATEAGDSKEAARLVASDWAAASTAQQAKELLADITQGKTLTATQALHHALLALLSMANELAIAKATGIALKRRIEELEASATAYKGIWREENTPYRPGALTTHKGVLWHAWKVTSDRPGASNDWQLMVKHERDR